MPSSAQGKTSTDSKWYQTGPEVHSLANEIKSNENERTESVGYLIKQRGPETALATEFSRHSAWWLKENNRKAFPVAV